MALFCGSEMMGVLKVYVQSGINLSEEYGTDDAFNT